MKTLTYPFCEKHVRALKAGDAVSISGLVHTGRDKFHKFFADGGRIPVDFRDGALYHCGPVVVRNGRGRSPEPSGGTRDPWRVVAAGPTTSVRENPYEPAFIAKSGVRVIIGKGGMDAATLAAMKKCGCVYVQAVGGAAALAAASVRRVAGVDFLEEFGAAEACWHFEMEDFRGVVAMDAHGVSLFDRVARTSAARLKSLVSRPAAPRLKSPVSRPAAPRLKSPVSRPAASRLKSPVSRPAAPRLKSPVSRPAASRLKSPVS